MLEEADRIFKAEQYYSAIEYYNKAIKKEKEKKLYCFYQIARCHQLAHQLTKAEAAYQKALEEGYTEANLYLNYGNTLRQLEKFDEAIQQYNAYLGINPNDKLVKQYVQGCKNAKAWKNEKTRYSTENVRALNSRESDFGVALFKRNGVVFTSTRDEAYGKEISDQNNEKFQSAFACYVDRKGKWGKPELLLGEVNTKNHDGAGVFNKAGTAYYFTRCDANPKEGGCKIFISKKEGTEWGKPEMISLFGDSVVVGQPALSEDGKTMYFVALDAEGGYGGRDIWMTTGSGTTWGEPVNLGETINTQWDEMFPYIHKDGVFFFSSNGHPGMGGLDIFASKRNGNNWAKPENMRAPINSGADDFNFVANKKRNKGFLSSNRPGGRGGDDIYKWIFEPLVFNAEILVINDSTNRPVPKAEVQFINLSDNTYVDGVTDKDGKISFRMKEETSYKISAKKEKFFKNEGSVSNEGVETSKDFEVDVRIAPFPDTTIIVLEDILYAFNDTALQTQSFASLDKLVSLLNKADNLQVGIYSHTDSRGKDDYNDNLSRGRANSVVAYLISKGIEKERLVAKGFGKRKLLISDAKIEAAETEEEKEALHQLNRRTEFEILGQNFKTTKIKYKRVTGEEEEEGSSVLD